MKIEIMMFIFAFGFCIGAVAAMVKEQYRRKKQMKRRTEFINRRMKSTTNEIKGAVQAFNQMNESMTTASKGITRFKGCFDTMTNDEYVDALKRDLNERKKSKSTNS
ncbi:MAG: hypothetical protein ACLUEZ_08600 [Oscillospiraceae bacterium]